MNVQVGITTLIDWEIMHKFNKDEQEPKNRYLQQQDNSFVPNDMMIDNNILQQGQGRQHQHHSHHLQYHRKQEQEQEHHHHNHFQHQQPKSHQQYHHDLHHQRLQQHHPHITNDMLIAANSMACLNPKPATKPSRVFSQFRGAAIITATKEYIDEERPIDSFQLRPWDIICQRGKDAFDHVGNRRLRLLVATNLVKYVNGRRQEKIRIVKNIAQMIHEANGRFVKQDSNQKNASGLPKQPQWVELTTIQARDKVGHVFRDYLRGQKKRKSSFTKPNNGAALQQPQENDQQNKKKRRDSAWIEQQDVTETQDAILRGMHIFLPEDNELQRSRLTVPDITIPDKS